MKIIFLDFDGVLNSQQSNIYYRRKGPATQLMYRETEFCPIAVSNLKFLLERLPNDWQIVASTSWRRNGLDEIRRIAQTYFNLDPSLIIAGTPVVQEVGSPLTTRQQAIEAYLYQVREEIKDYIILEDQRLEGHEGHYYKTSPFHGLQLLDVISILSARGIHIDFDKEQQ